MSQCKIASHTGSKHYEILAKKLMTTFFDPLHAVPLVLVSQTGLLKKRSLHAGHAAAAARSGFKISNTYAVSKSKPIFALSKVK